MNKITNLKFISRVGIGLDGVDLITAEKKGIKVSYTPDVPAPAIFIVPDDVICEYQSQKRGEKNKEIYLGAPGNTCQKQIVCPKK